MSLDFPDKLIEVVSQTDTFDESDKAISLLPRTVKNILSPLLMWNMKQEYKVKQLAMSLEEKLVNVDPLEIIDPPEYVAVPAIFSLSYSMDEDNLRDMYCNLLKSAMTKSISSKVHPAFVEIIKQLSPLDSIVIKECLARPYTPLIDIRAIDSISSNSTILDCFSNFIPESISHNPELVAASVSNAERLGLVMIDRHHPYSNDSLYEEMANSTAINSLLTNTDIQVKGFAPNLKTVLFKCRLTPSPLGLQFQEVCL